MPRHRHIRHGVVRFTGILLVALGALDTAAAWRGDDPGVVAEWNQLLQANIPATAGLLTPRYFTMLHIAMFDAVNSIERDYARYHVLVRATPVASTEAAAAQDREDRDERRVAHGERSSRHGH